VPPGLPGWCRRSLLMCAESEQDCVAEEVIAMPKTVEITMTQLGFAVSAGDRTATFRRLEEAVTFAREHLARADYIREMKARIG
jgi:hypothetical protein